MYACLHAKTSPKAKFGWTAKMNVLFESHNKSLTSPLFLAFPEFEKPFLVGPDASSVALGAILSQKKRGGKTHPIQHDIITMTKAEQNYSACDREALAAVSALNKFRMYFLSFIPFILETDHQPLRSVLEKRDIHGLLAQWLYVLAK